MAELLASTFKRSVVPLQWWGKHLITRQFLWTEIFRFFLCSQLKLTWVEIMYKIPLNVEKWKCQTIKKKFSLMETKPVKAVWNITKNSLLDFFLCSTDAKKKMTPAQIYIQTTPFLPPSRTRCVDRWMSFETKHHILPRILQTHWVILGTLNKLDSRFIICLT